MPLKSENAAEDLGELWINTLLILSELTRTLNELEAYLKWR